MARDPRPYSELLKDPRWQRKRLEVMNRDHWRCRSCGTTTRNLQVDHKHYERDRPPWEIASEHLWTLCDDCHRRVTVTRREAHYLVNELEISDLVRVCADLRSFVGLPKNERFEWAQRFIESARHTDGVRHDEEVDDAWAIIGEAALAVSDAEDR